ncbi:uncharacterized protein LOC113470043 [Diaphorina citri]|uniref:Uncharacterized protein LOC113470043 n=1 Tax=Diaphorina citri TaxID=121845 RepID=A0A3Q0J682_DIACI|nr:uncharacterized protein LOC113470043 [Diaphorina citri]
MHEPPPKMTVSVIQHCAKRSPDLLYTLDLPSLANKHTLNSSVKRTESHCSGVQSTCSCANLSRCCQCAAVSFGPVAALFGTIPTSFSLLLTVNALTCTSLTRASSC